MLITACIQRDASRTIVTGGEAESDLSCSKEEPVMATVASFQIDYTQFLNQLGETTQALPASARDPMGLIPCYRAMLLARLFDAKAIALQRTGQLGTFASALGQEAIGVGVASVMRTEDVLLPSYRDHAA